MAAAPAAGAARLLSPLCVSALMVASLVGHPIRTDAQSISTPAAPRARASASPGAEAEASALNLLVGRSAVIDIGTPIARVSLTSPDVADALVTTNQQLLVHGKAPGTISMFVWNRAGGIKRYEVIVQRDLSQLTEQLKQLFPGETITVDSNGRDVVISGTVSSKYVTEKAADVAAGYVEKKENVVNLLRQAEGIASNQVLLRVRFAEVSRSALTELGISLFSDGNNNKIGSSSTQQFAAPFFDQNSPMQGKNLNFSDYLNIYFFDTANQLGTVVKALQNKGLFQTLAEPNLIAENGKEASFLAGGEFPYPVAQGQQGNLAITIVFKEFGIRLRFTPTVLGGDLIHLKVAPEVSALDFANAVVANGFRIPSLTTRRAETEVELRDGQTFAIAGLMNNTVASSLRKIPGIGDIPILGLLFQSKSAQKDRTELVVMITPQIVRAGSLGAAPGLPNLQTPFLGLPKKQLAPPPPWLGPTPPGGSAYSEPVAPSPETPMPTNLRPRLASEPVPPEPIAQSPQPAEKPVAAATSPAPARSQKAAKTAEKSVEPSAPPASASGASSAPAQPSMLTPPEETPRKRIESTGVDVDPAPAPSASANSARKPTKEERQAAERGQESLKKQEKADREAAARDNEARLKQEKIDARKRKEEAERAAEQAKAEQQRAAEDAEYEAERAADAREQAKKAAAEQARIDAEAAKRQAAAAKKQAEENKRIAEAQKKHEKGLAEAEARLRAAQAQYQAEVERSKKDKVAVVPQPQQP